MTAVSVITVSYRTGPVLGRSLRAALDQDDVAEVILVDNGNTDAVLAELHGLAAREPKLTILSGHGNIGFACACNLGAQHATGEIFFFLNPDAVLPAGATRELVREAKRSGAERWAIGPKLINPDGTEQQGSRRDVLTPWNAFVEASRLYKIAPRHPHFRRFNSHGTECRGDEVQKVPCLSGAAFLVPREAFEEVGGFDERYFLHVEDIDFFVRLSKLGASILFVPKVEVTHYKSSSRVDPLKIERRKKQSLNLYFATHYTGIYPKGFLTLLRGMLWLSFGFRAVKLRLKSFIGLCFFALRHGPRALARVRRWPVDKEAP
ncbi:MAG: glycosyltransferase family 2 protein [Pseudomonadota bacterium]